MIQRYIAQLEQGISNPRLARYRPPGGTDLDMAVTYLWNVALAEALYPALAALEVTLRNSIHHALTIREGTDMWFRMLLESGQLSVYAQTHLKLYNRLKRTEPTAGQLVAELTFGFWTTLLSQPYHQGLWAPNKTALVKTVLPHLPPTPSNRHFVHQRYNNLRILRNRVMHHEPIWYRPRLQQEWEEMIEAIGWINPTIRDSVLILDHFDDTYRNGKDRIEMELHQRFGL